MAVNTWRAISTPMLAALRIMRRVVHRFQFHIRLQHIAGERNTIADDMSRGRQGLVQTRAQQIWGHAEWQDPPDTVGPGAHEIVETTCVSKRCRTPLDQVRDV